MEIRLATEEDIPRMQEIFRHARQFMADKGNPNQWTEGYPAEELIREDIAHGDCFVCLSEGRTVATFVLRSGVDPTYTVIYDGQWPDPLLERRRTTGLSPVKNTKGRIETLPTDLSNKNTKGRVNALPNDLSDKTQKEE